MNRVVLPDKEKYFNQTAEMQRENTGSVIIEKMFKDGLYVDDPQVLQKYTSINIQKLEERLLREGRTEFFHPNGEIQLHNDLLADQITKPEN